MIKNGKWLFINVSLLILELILVMLEFPEEIIKGVFLLLIIWTCFNIFRSIKNIKEEIEKEFGKESIDELSGYQTGTVLLAATFILGLLRSIFEIPLILPRSTFWAFLIWALVRMLKMFKQVILEKIKSSKDKKDDFKEENG